MNLVSGPREFLFSLGKNSRWLGLFLAVAAGASAAPLEDLPALSLFPQVDLAKLKGGHIMVERGPVGDFPRGIYLESCYFIQVSMKDVGDAFLHWNPLDHKDSDVRLYREFLPPPAADVFHSLKLNRALAEDRWLLDETTRVAKGGEPGDLHLTKEEAGIVRQHATDPSKAWSEILRRRSEAAASGGLPAVAPYGTDRSISPRSEFRGLLKMAPKAAKHFRPITQTKPFTPGGKPPSETIGYWNAEKVNKHTSLQLGLFAAQKSVDSWQLVDCLYYPSDTYFMSLNLFQLWPVDGGTLVWQVSFVSAPFRAYLGGIDRHVAGKMMTEETIDTIKAFRAALEKRR
ncbi:hypothetical protein BH18VER2_BH18VER2_06360 [soil metagenome]